MDFILAIFVTTFVASLIVYCKRMRTPEHFPPGPLAVPLLGHLHILGLEPHKAAIKLKEKYGPVLGLKFGLCPAVIISDHNLAKKALASPFLAGRPIMRKAFARVGDEFSGIIFTSGRAWHEQRTFALRRLREIGGFGTRSMEDSITGQVVELVNGLKKDASDGHGLNTTERLNIAVVNALWGIIAGEPFALEDPDVIRLMEIFGDAVKNFSMMVMLPMLFPFVYDYLPNWITRKTEMITLHEPFVDFLQPHIDEHYKSNVPGNPRDFIDAYIDEINNTTDTNSSFHPRNCKSGLVTSVLDLFQAGVETMTATLSWIFLLLSTYHDVQDEVVAEIEIHLKGRYPSLSDRKFMPYTEAMLHEVMRFRPLLPLMPFHSATEDVYFSSFNIPKDTMVFVNVYESHFSKCIWGDPENFRPERWLNTARTNFERREGFLNFSFGKRVCIGEQLARDELFLFTVGILQVFRLEVEKNSCSPSIEPKIMALTHGPLPHKIRFALRNGHGYVTVNSE